MCKYYGYIRVSTETQVEKGHGLEAQEDKIKEYAVKNGIDLEYIFRDEGISGNIKDTDDDDAINKRAGLVNMLAAMKKDDAVIVLNTSRLWRSDMTRAIIRRELMRKCAHVISVEQPQYDLYTTSPNDYLINAIMEALDVYDRMSVSLKLARGRTTKAHTGVKACGTCPYGYRWNEKKEVEADPYESTIVKHMFTLAQSKMSLRQIADTLNADGLTTRRGKLFQAGSVAAILHNDFYLGVLTHAGEKLEGNHPALVSKIQFGKVQAALERAKK